MTQRSRRAFLGTLAAGSAIGTAGCLFDQDSVSVLSAGSLAVVLDGLGEQFTAETDIQFQGDFHGANVVMQMIEDGTKHPDVAISADVDLLRDRLYPEYASWDIVFAANEVGFAYNPDTALGKRLDNGDPWYDVLLDAPEGAVAISEPDLDPLGYRAVHMLELAEDQYDVEGLRETVVDAAYREPDEPRLLTGIETGDRAIAISYKNMAVDYDLPFYELPAELNFSDPAYRDQYESVSYTTEDGYTATGSTMAYNITVLDSADDPDHGREFVTYLLENSSILERNGLSIPDRLPTMNGTVPDSLTAIPRSES